MGGKKWLLFTVAMGLFGSGMVLDRRKLVLYSVGLFLGGGLVTMRHGLIGGLAGCSVCRVPFMFTPASGKEPEVAPRFGTLSTQLVRQGFKSRQVFSAQSMVTVISSNFVAALTIVNLSF